MAAEAPPDGCCWVPLSGMYEGAEEAAAGEVKLNCWGCGCCSPATGLPGAAAAGVAATAAAAHPGLSLLARKPAPLVAEAAGLAAAPARGLPIPSRCPASWPGLAPGWPALPGVSAACGCTSDTSRAFSRRKALMAASFSMASALTERSSSCRLSVWSAAAVLPQPGGGGGEQDACQSGGGGGCTGTAASTL